ncbi:MAG: amino acid ABC transporter substrate-binding protein [Desulfobacula sp.]|nr:amino acid ABC transporter substrate-binding protein [Desulfobacula sp.]
MYLSLKRILTILTIIILFPIHSFADQNKTLHISAGTEGWLPVAYKDINTNNVKGLSYDVIEEIAKRLNIVLKINRVPWKRMLKMLEIGDLDMAIAIYWNSERDKHFLYSTPYFQNEARIFVKKGKEFNLNKLEDLVPYTGIIPAGGSFGERFDSFAKNDLKLYQLPGNDLRAKKKKINLILLERYDFFIQDYLDGMMYINQAGFNDKIVPLPYVINKTNVHFAMSKKSKKNVILPKINEIIKSMVEDGSIEKMAKTYIENYSNKIK